MQDPRTTLTMYPAIAAFAAGPVCAGAGTSVSKRLALLLGRYANMVSSAFGRDRPAPDEWIALDRALDDVDFSRAIDPQLIPAFVSAAKAKVSDQALNRIAYKVEQMPVPALYAVADVLERFRADQPDRDGRTAEAFITFAERTNLGYAVAVPSHP